jgi:DEAD/DEAH box helicase domain-containing protein
VASLLLMCDPRDLGVSLTEEIAQGLQAFEPNLYLYDAYPGGIGQSAPLFRLTSKLLAHTAELLGQCPCDAGCPSCVGPVGEVGERGKEAAAAFLALLA